MRTQAPGGIGFFLGFVLAAATTFFVIAAGAASQPVLSVVALVAVVDLIALISTAGARWPPRSSGGACTRDSCSASSAS
ncbi:hypothetical protein FXN61_09760 [Lentzea sp. PSKA42]|uniref:Uncharacterized protein n=1 Tax=Lentzea indica TaxID=2604800 RepID=A0ABX1FEQ3_9PSEU|nr:hypothetical protein [Lentzea indica]NKE57103.1 hypothetical protein [Lentzea indica]